MLSLIMEKTRAWEQLNDPRHVELLTMEGVRVLALRAGYSEAEAQAAANEHGWSRLCAGEVM